tara:strand:+ start:1572 stop:1676 length:105 start_codon:yes stop_codon:yes gene_type:complete
MLIQKFKIKVLMKRVDVGFENLKSYSNIYGNLFI